MKKLSGILDYFMRRKLPTLGVMAALFLGSLGLRNALVSTPNNTALDENSSGACLSVDIPAQIGGGNINESESGPADSLTLSPSSQKSTGFAIESSSTPSVDSALVSAQITQNNPVEQLPEIPSTGALDKSPNLFKLAVFVLGGILVAAGLLKFISDHYLR